MSHFCHHTSIHSHETYIGSDGKGNFENVSSALKPGPEDPENFKKFGLNIIVGNLGEPYQRTDPSTGKKTDVMPKQGAAFYKSTGVAPVVQISVEALRKIIGK